ncbi:MAG TPA: sugar phosphate isomerase/epimerase family protein [Polyangiaceae bacterium]
MVKLSFTTLGCPGWSLEKIAEVGKSLGYDGVELRTHPDGNHLSPEASAKEAREVAALFRDHALPIASVMGYTTFAHTERKDIEDNQRHMRQLIGLAAEMHAPFIRTFAGRIPQGLERSRAVDIVVNAILPLAVEAAGAGTKIGLETHDDWCSGALLKQVCEGVNSPGFGVVYDAFNAFVAGIEPWQHTYECIQPHLAYCQLKDGYRDLEGKLHYVYLGAGELPTADILSRLKQDHFSGYLSFEWEKKWHAELAEPEQAFPHFPFKVRQLWGTA